MTRVLSHDKGFAVLLLCAALTAIAPATRAADFTITNFGPGDTYTENTGLGIGSFSGSVSFVFATGVSFVSPGDMQVVSVEVPLFGFTDDDTNTRFAIHENDGGLPGDIIGSVDQLVTTPIGTSLIYADFTGVNVPLANGQTYWLTVSLPDVAPLSQNNGSVANNDQAFVGNASSNNNGATWSLDNSFSPAYRILGNVPEPASLALFGACAAAMLRRR